MFEFNQNHGQVIKLNFDASLLHCMLQFMYTGQATINSENLIDLLDLSHQYMLPKLKLAIETVLISNLSVETYLDTYQVAKAFECTDMHQLLMQFGLEHVKELRAKNILS